MPVYRKVQCNHCKEPACASACPIHAYSKTPEGAVRYDREPLLRMPVLHDRLPLLASRPMTTQSALEPKIVKCTMCYETRVKHGKITACAEACPAGAITFGKRDELIKIARNRIEKNPDKYIDHIYGEHEAGGTNWIYLSGVPFEQLGFPANVPNKPPIELTKGFLSSVPLVFTIWPALFGMCYAAVRHRDEVHEEKDRIAQRRRNANEQRISATAKQENFQSWFMDKLLMGMTWPEYLRKLITPFNIDRSGHPERRPAAHGHPLHPGPGLRHRMPRTTTPGASCSAGGSFPGVPLSATGFVMATAYYIFGFKRYHSLVRLGVLTGFLGYLFAVIYLLTDLGQALAHLLPHGRRLRHGVGPVPGGLACGHVPDRAAS